MPEELPFATEFNSTVRNLTDSLRREVKTPPRGSFPSPDRREEFERRLKEELQLFPRESFIRLSKDVEILGERLLSLECSFGITDEVRVCHQSFRRDEGKADEDSAELTGAIELVLDAALKLWVDFRPPIVRDEPVRFNNQTGTSYVDLLIRTAFELIHVCENVATPSEMRTAVADELSQWNGIEHLRTKKTRPISALTAAALSDIHRELRRVEHLRSLYSVRDDDLPLPHQPRWSKKLTKAEICDLFGVVDWRTVEKQMPEESLRKIPKTSSWLINLDLVPGKVMIAYQAKYENLPSPP